MNLKDFQAAGSYLPPMPECLDVTRFGTKAVDGSLGFDSVAHGRVKKTLGRCRQALIDFVLGA